MSKKTIAGLIVEIGGDTTKLGTALKDVDKRSADLSKELGEINRLLKLDPGNTELLSQKQKVLADCISTTGERLKLLREAEDQVTEAFKRGEASEEELRALQREIVATEKKLNGYEAASKETAAASNAAWKKAKEQLVELGDKASKIAAKGIAAVGTAAAAAVGSLVKLAFSGANTADELGDMAGKTGLSVEQLQKYKYAADMAGTTLENLTGAQTKLTQTMSKAKSGTGDAADAFRRLEVDVTGANGELRNADDVFNDVLDALGQVGNETERDALSMKIFGKSAKELNPLIKAGAGALKAFGDEAERIGAVVSEDTLAPLSEMQTEVKKVRAQFDALKLNVGSQFAPVITRVLQKIQTLIEKGQKTIGTPRIREAVKKLADTLERFLERGVDAVLKVLPKLVSAVTWLLEHLKELLTVFGSLWAILKTVKVVHTVTEAFKTAKSAVEALRTAALATKTAQEGLNKTMEAGSMAAGGWIGILIALAAAMAAFAKSKLDAIREHNEELIRSSENTKRRLEEIAQSMEDANGAYSNAVSESEAAARMADQYLSRLERLEKQGKLTSNEQKEYNALVAKLKAVMPDLNLSIDKQTGFLKEGAKALKEQVKQWREKVRISAMEDLLKETFKQQVELQKEAAKAQDDYNKKLKLITELAPLWEEFGNKSVKATEENADRVQRFSALISEACSDGARNFREFEVQVSASKEAMEFATEAYEANVREADALADTYTDLINSTGLLGEQTDDTAEIVEGLETNIESMSEAAQEAADTHIKALIDASKNMFDVIDTGNTYTMQQLLENLKKNREAIDRWHENLSTLYARGASSEFVQYLEELGLGYASAVDTIANATEEDFKQLVNAWQSNVDNAYSKGKSFGVMTATGVIEGLDSKKYDLKASARRAAKWVASEFANVLEIHSPSRVFKRFAGFSAEGWIGELDARSVDMAAAAHRAASAVEGGFNPRLTGNLYRRLAGRNDSVRIAAAQSADASVGKSLDAILKAVEAGRVLLLDGKRLVGGTAATMDSALGGRVVIGRRTVLA